MKAKLIILIILLIPLIGLLALESNKLSGKPEIAPSKKSHWFILHRKTNQEFLYFGIPGEINNSKIVRKFQVKSGIPGKSPTPLPVLLGRKYWLITHKESSADNPDTAPYFLRLNIPSGENWPYGPVPYEECTDVDGTKVQCDWVLPGYFGLHGIGESDLKLSDADPGSSGCIRHTNADITYLYNLLDPSKEEIRYYIEDN